MKLGKNNTDEFVIFNDPKATSWGLIALQPGQTEPVLLPKNLMNSQKFVEDQQINSLNNTNLICYQVPNCSGPTYSGQIGCFNSYEQCMEVKNNPTGILIPSSSSSSSQESSSSSSSSSSSGISCDENGGNACPSYEIPTDCHEPILDGQGNVIMGPRMYVTVLVGGDSRNENPDVNPFYCREVRCGPLQESVQNNPDLARVLNPPPEISGPRTTKAGTQFLDNRCDKSKFPCNPTYKVDCGTLVLSSPEDSSSSCESSSATCEEESAGPGPGTPGTPGSNNCDLPSNAYSRHYCAEVNSDHPKVANQQLNVGDRTCITITDLLGYKFNGIIYEEYPNQEIYDFCFDSQGNWNGNTVGKDDVELVPIYNIISTGESSSDGENSSSSDECEKSILYNVVKNSEYSATMTECEQQCSGGASQGQSFFKLNNQQNNMQSFKSMSLEEQYPHGPGTKLSQMFEKIGIKASPTCSCKAKARLMNEKGVEWCEQNVDTIVGWLKEEANKRKLPFMTSAAKLIVKRAISLSKRDSRKI